MKDTIIQLCKDVAELLAKKGEDDEAEDDLYAIMDDEMLDETLLRDIDSNVIQRLNRVRDIREPEERLQQIRRALDDLPVKCDDCGAIMHTVDCNWNETQYYHYTGGARISIFNHLDGDEPYEADDSDGDITDSSTDDFESRCVDCSELYSTDWKVVVPTRVATMLADIPGLLDKRMKDAPRIPQAKKTILSQFSEIKHRPQLEYDPYDNADEGVGVPFGESMEKLLV